MDRRDAAESAFSSWKNAALRVLRSPFEIFGVDVVRRSIRRNHPARICFLHVPKCAGVSINRALSRAFGPHRLVGVDPEASSSAADLREQGISEFRHFLLYYFLSLNNVNVVTGHFPWSDEIFDRFGGKWQFITVLRDPLRRWYSHYYFDRYKPGGYYRIQESLEQFIESERAREMGAEMVRYLSDPHISSVTEATEQAIENLKKFRVIGFVDDLTAFERQMQKEFDVPIVIPKLNGSPAKNGEKSDWEERKVADRVRELCAPDIALYEAAKKLAQAAGGAAVRG